MMKKLILLFSVLLVFGCSDYCKQEEYLYYFPPNDSDTWETVKPEDLGWDTDKLDETIQWISDHKSVAFIIMYKGKIVVEEHWIGWDIHKRIKIASITKSITAVLIGLAQEQGLLSITNPVSDYLDDGWSNTVSTTESKITIQQLLSMTSGLDEYLNEIYEPGTNYSYSTSAFYRLWLILEEVTGKTVEAFADEVLFAKIGMSKAVHWTKGGNMLPRDLARLGSLMINEGIWNDNSVISNTEYFYDMLNPSQKYVNCYGYLWWLNNDCNAQIANQEFLSFPDAPTDMYAAMGAWDQRLFIIPSEDLVIVRLGVDNQLPFWGEGSFNNGFWKLMSQVINK